MCIHNLLFENNTRRWNFLTSLKLLIKFNYLHSVNTIVKKGRLFVLINMHVDNIFVSINALKVSNLNRSIKISLYTNWLWICIIFQIVFNSMIYRLPYDLNFIVVENCCSLVLKFWTYCLSAVLSHPRFIHIIVYSSCWRTILF